MFNKKEIAELQAQVKVLQEQKTETDAITELSTRINRVIGSQEINLIYQDERITSQEDRLSKLEKLVARIIDYNGMTEGHLR